MSGDVISRLRHDTLTSLAVVLACTRLGAVLGLLPVIVASVGPQNVLPFALHLTGAAATVLTLVQHRAVLRLIATAFTGYSTIALASTAPPFLAMWLWACGGALVTALLVVALRPEGRPRRGAWIAGAVGGIVAGGVSLLLLT
ncbi:hypothetical protein [Microbacterium sp. LMI1-1-1.1]|uniref:hypothetical protein n=1 Tax=Microbacterium sp. LMI1-1-1.1 TaxID=3135223 RepID=UPI00346779C1